MQNKPRVTLLFLLYNASRTVTKLLELALSQTHADYPNQADWLKIRFADDCSKDNTIPILKNALEASGNPPQVELIQNTKNLGLAGSLNHHLRQIDTPYVLTCHLDCFFVEKTYIASMLLLMEKNVNFAVITGKPTLDSQTTSYIEKVNTVVNLMDVLPTKNVQNSGVLELCSVGFAEGRCDLFRMEALQKVGFYPTELRTSGEDQLLAIRFREAGYALTQALNLHYELSVSEDQNSVRKIISHMHLFGRTTPAILKRGKAALKGISAEEGGHNRGQRKELRALQLLHASNCLLFSFTLLASTLVSVPVVFWISLTAFECFILFSKWRVFRPHLKFVDLNFRDQIQIFFLQFPLDFAYFFGFLEGALKILTLKEGDSIQ